MGSGLPVVVLSIMSATSQSTNWSSDRVAEMLADALRPASCYEVEFDVIAYTPTRAESGDQDIDHISSVISVRWVAQHGRLRVEEKESHAASGRLRDHFVGTWDGSRFLTKSRQQISIFAEPQHLMAGYAGLFGGGDVSPAVSAMGGTLDTLRRGEIEAFHHDDRTLAVKWRLGRAEYECEVDLATRYISRYTVHLDSQHGPVRWQYQVIEWKEIDAVSVPRAATWDVEYGREIGDQVVRTINRHVYQLHSWRRYQCSDELFSVPFIQGDVVRDVQRRILWVVGEYGLQIEDTFYETPNPIWDDPEPELAAILRQRSQNVPVLVEDGRGYANLVAGATMILLAGAGLIMWRLWSKVVGGH